MRFRSQLGMSLIETVVAVGLLGLLSIFVIHLQTTTLVGQKTIEQRYSMADTHVAVRKLLGDARACEQTFQNKRIPTTSGSYLDISEIKNREGEVVYALNTPYENRNLQFSKMQLSHFVPSEADSDGGTAKLILHFAPGNGLASSMVMQPREIAMRVEANRNDAYKIFTCAALFSERGEQFWSVNEHNDLYFSGNQVGIGVETPTSRVDVQGDAAVTEELRVAQIQNIRTIRMSSSSVCLPGAQRYDPVDQTMKFCHNNIWKPLGGFWLRNPARNLYSEKNIGVGVNAPTKKLDVKGNSVFRGYMKMDPETSGSQALTIKGRVSIGSSWSSSTPSDLTTRLSVDGDVDIKGVLETSSMIAQQGDQRCDSSTDALMKANSVNNFKFCDATAGIWKQFTAAEDSSLADMSVPKIRLRVLQIATGLNHSCALLTNNSVWCWGKNTSSLLGVGSSESTVASPAPVLTSTSPNRELTNVVEIGAGNDFTCARLRDGSVWCWGKNGYGQLGRGSLRSSSVAVQALGLTGTTQLSVGESNACAVLSDSTAKCWGKNSSYQLGNNSRANSNQPVNIKETSSTSLGNIAQVSVGDIAHICAKMNDKTLRCWGGRYRGRLGISGGYSGQQKIASEKVIGIDTATQVNAGSFNGCAVLEGDFAQCWGDGSLGQLGDGTTSLRNSPPIVVQGLSQVKNVFSFKEYTCAVLKDNNLMCWGTINGIVYSSPALVTNFLANQIDVNSNSSNGCVVLPDKTARCWGDNSFDQLSDGLTEWVQPISGLSLYTYDSDCSASVRDKSESTVTPSLACNLGPALRDEDRDGVCKQIPRTCHYEGAYVDREKVCNVSKGSCRYECSSSASWIRNTNTCEKGEVRTPAPLPPPRPCLAEKISSSNSTATLGSSETRVACNMSADSHGAEKAGSCQISSATSYEGQYGSRKRIFYRNSTGSSCRYRCEDGTWEKTSSTSNTCKQLKVRTPDPVVQCIGKTFAASSSTALFNKKSCTVTDEYNAVKKSGTCDRSAPACTYSGNFGSRLKKCKTPRGSCKYGCSRGTWTKQNNNCGLATTTTPEPNGCNAMERALSESTLSTSDYGVSGTVSKTTCTVPDTLVSGRSKRIDGTCGATPALTCRYEGEYENRVQICKKIPTGYNTCNYRCNKSDGRWATVTNGNKCGYVETNTSTPETRPYVTQIAGGRYHSCALMNDGTAKCWGKNEFGQLGNGTKDSSSTPVKVSDLTNAVQIASGKYHTCAVLRDGTAKCWGNNGWGQLGNNSTINSSTPVAVLRLTNAVQISSGLYHSCAVLRDGTAKCWGKNEYGQLGDGTRTNRKTPVKVSVLTNAIQIALGAYHTCAVLRDGTAKCWGYNNKWQLGASTTQTCGTVYTPCSSTPVKVSVLTNVVQISLGGRHTCAVLSNGTAKCWGWNKYGQLGNGTTSTPRLTPVAVDGLTNAIQIALGGRHTCAVLSNGTAKCWGFNGEGQLGDGTRTQRNTPVTVSGLTNAVQIALGEEHTCAVLRDGTAKCWGDGNSGQLGDGSTTERLTPVFVDGTLLTP